MRELPAPLVRALLAGVVRPLLGPPVPVRVQRRGLDGLAALFAGVLPPGTTTRRTVLGGRPAEVVEVPGADGPPVLLLHGGGFLTGSPRTHRGFAAHLAASAGAPVHVLDYRLAPEHPHPAAVDDALAALDELGGPVALVGDSAGGAVAVLAAVRLRDEGRPLPYALGLVSPVADLTGRASAAWEGPDPLLRASWLRQGVEAWAGERAAALSPLHSDLTGLPPVLVHVCSDERLLPEGEALVDALRAAGVDAVARRFDGLWHDVHVQAGQTARATAAVVELGTWLRDRRPG